MSSKIHTKDFSSEDISPWTLYYTDSRTYFNPKIDNTIIFKNPDKKEVGRFDFNSDKLKFIGDVNKSTKVFIDFLLDTFNNKIEEIKNNK